MWLSILEVSFGVVFVIAVITQLIWPLLTDTPLFPWFGKRRLSRKQTPELLGTKKTEKTIGGEVVAIRQTRSGEEQ